MRKKVDAMVGGPNAPSGGRCIPIIGPGMTKCGVGPRRNRQTSFLAPLVIH